MNKLFTFVMVALLLALPQAGDAGQSISPIDVVNKRMESHNKHDLKLFMSLYSEDIQVYDYPDTPIGKKGKAHIESIFAPLFKDKDVSVVIHYQIEQGKYVVNHESVTRQGKLTKYVLVYEVENGLIKSVRFIRDY